MRLFVPSAERRPDPEPLRTDDALVVRIGTAVWAVLLVAALLGHRRLSADGHGWWVWTPVVGILLGLYGLRYVRRRQDRPERD